MMRFIFLLWLPFFLMSCSYISLPASLQPKDKHYLEASSIAPLKIPPGISSSAFQNEYPVPYRYYPEKAKTLDLTPPGLTRPLI